MDLTGGATEAVLEEERQSNLLTRSIYTNSSLPEGIDVATLLQARQKAEMEVMKVMQEQVTKLTEISKVNS